MSSLAACIKKAGKALDGEDVAAVREIYDDLVKAGAENPAQHAIDEYLGLLAAERTAMLEEARLKGGDVTRFDKKNDIRLAKSSPERAIAEKITVTGILYGNEQLEGIVPTGRKRKGGWRETLAVDVARALEARTRKQNRGKPLTGYTARSKEILSEVLAIETAAALENTGNAENWYTLAFANAMAIANLLHPELANNPVQQAIFKLGLAISSNSAAVAINTENAEFVYAHYKRAGRFPTSGLRGSGSPIRTISDSFERANVLLDKWGEALFARFLVTRFSVAELTSLGLPVPGELAGHVTYGSAIFGPKVGGGFFPNLMGDLSPLTADRWWMRFWGRITGHSISPDELAEAQVERLLQAAGKYQDKVKQHGYTLKQLRESDAALLLFARKVYVEFDRNGFTERTSLNNAARALWASTGKELLSPRNGVERAWMREVAAAALAKLAERGIHLNTGTMQALVWYPEKDLFQKYQTREQKNAEPTDYDREFERLALARGIDAGAIEAARRGAVRIFGGGPAGAPVPGQGGLPLAAAKALGAKDRLSLMRRGAIASARKKVARSYLPRAFRKKTEQRLQGQPVRQIFRPARALRNAYSRVELPIPDLVELDANFPGVSEFFHSQLLAAAKGNPYGSAVHPYTAEEYADMRLFVDETGTAGIALRGDEIVSIFRGNDAPVGSVHALMSLAIAEGGARLDTFDTGLPEIYAEHGFRAVARVPWSEALAPKGWSKKAFNEFNQGEPDVVYMVYDRNNFTAYTPLDGVVADNQRAANRRQATALRKIQESNKPDSVLLRIEDEEIDRLNQDPSSPLAQLHKLGATMEDQARHNPGVVQSVIEAAVEMKDSGGISALLAMIPRRNLVDFLPKEKAPALQELIRIYNRMDGRRNQLLVQYEELAHRWAQYGRKAGVRAMGQLSEMMHASTLAGLDPSKDYVSLKDPKKMSDADKIIDARRREQYLLLKDYFDTVLDAEARVIYGEVRDAYLEIRDKNIAALEARIDASIADAKAKRVMLDLLRKNFERGRVTGPYFPLVRFGDLWAVAKDDEGIILSYSRFRTRAEQQAWIKEWKADGATVDQGRRLPDDSQLRSIDPVFAARVTELVPDAGLKDEIWQMYLAMLPEMSARKRLMHRKGRIGFAADALQAYGHTMFHASHQLAKLELMHKADDKILELRDQVREIEKANDKDLQWAGQVLAQVEKRHKAAANPNANPLSVKITGAGFVWFLGFSVSAMLVNLSQTALVAMPLLAAKFGFVATHRELLRAAGLYAGARGDIENRLRGDEHAAFAEARRIGMFEKTQAHELAGVSESGAEAYGSKWATLMRTAAFMFHKAEQFNREVTFLASYRLARQKGLSQADAILLGEDLTWDAHFDYSQANRPVWMQGDIARVVTLFKQYSLNMTYRVLRDLNDSLRGESAEVRKEARTRAAGILTMSFLLSGITGLPTAIIFPIRAMIDLLLRDDEDEDFVDTDTAMRVYLTDMFGAKVAEIIMKGPFDALTGLTLSSRVSLSELWLRDANPNDSPERELLARLGDAIGPIGSTAVQSALTVERIKDEGVTSRGLEMLLPKFTRDVVRTFRYATEGVTTSTSPAVALFTPDELGRRDLMWQAMGFTPARLTAQYEQNRALRGAEKKILQRRSLILDRIAAATFNQDQKALEKAYAQAAEFTRQFPNLEITGNSVQRSLEARADIAERNVGGVALDPRMYNLYDELRFVPLKEKATEE